MTLWKVLMTGLQTSEGNLYSVICDIKKNIDIIEEINDTLKGSDDRAPHKRRKPLFCNMLYKKIMIWFEENQI